MKKALYLKRALRTALLVLLLSVVGMVEGYAYDFVVEGIRYEITSTATNTVGVTGADSYLYDVVIPETVVYDGITYSVTSIERLAFRNNTWITSVTIPSSISAIKRYAFCYCSALSIVYFNATNCTIMGESDGSGNPFGYVFKSCPSLTTLNIGPNVEHIPDRGFDACTSLTAVNITSIDSWYNIDFGSNPLFRAHNLYLNGELLTNLVIPETVSEIKPISFYGATCLTNLTIPESVEYIGESAFRDCSNLTMVNYYANCSEIGYKVFGGCNSLTSFNIGNNVQVIPNELLFNCSSLTSIIIPNSVICIGHNAFSGTGLTHITIPGSVETMGSAFCGCENLTSVDFFAINCSTTFPTGFASPFGNCSSLSRINIGDNVQTIPDGVFYNCTGLTSIIIPSTCITIGRCSFQNCSSLKTIIALSSTPPSLGANAFLNISPIASLFVPCGSQMAYFSNWNIFEYNNIHEDCTPRPVSISSIITGGIITSSVSQATMGQEVQITVTPNPGMELSSLAVYNASDPTQIIPITPVGKTSSIYSFVMPPFAVAVSAQFEPGTTYSININPSISGGAVTASTSSATAGEIVTLNVRPNSGYELQSLMVYNVNDVSQTVPVANNSFIMPSFDVMVSAYFNYISVDENGFLDASIYPNPSNGKVKIESENLLRVSIFNTLGQRVYEGSATGDVFECDLSNREAGVYLIRLETVNGMATKRVVLTK